MCHDDEDEISEPALAASHSVAQQPAFNQSTITPKIPPAFDGTTSWFGYEEQIEDWLAIATLTPRKHGPSLKNQLHGTAEMYKAMLDTDALKDPDTGVKYFKDTLRQYFVKGVQHVFLWRFLLFFRCYRGSQEMIVWLGRFEIVAKRVMGAWMDLYVERDINDQAFLTALTAAARREIDNAADPH
ncbi:unnamed protein product [Effrenium voratum]|nr:unnamed protein product [Effrenium voratum]